MKKAVLGLMMLCSITEHAMAESEQLTLICAEDSAVGYAWEAGAWSKASFAPDTYAIRRIPRSQYKSAMLCEDDRPKPYPLNTKDFEVRKACYSMTKLGEDTDALSYSMCDEIVVGGKLNTVHCKEPIRMSFSTSGNFIRHPSHSDVSTKSPKDPLVLSVGKCKVAR